MPRLLSKVRLSLFILACLFSGAPEAYSGELTEGVRKPPPFDQFLVLPLRIHILRADELPEINCALADADVVRIVRKVNHIWAQAGIYWGVESIVREPAAKQDAFRLARDLDPSLSLSKYRMLISGRRGAFDGFHVFYLHKFPVNGVWMGEDYALVQETARLREVEGGIDEPVPRVTAHELAHGLGLAHRQDTTNLLASGTTGTSLNAREVETVRHSALKRAGTKTVLELKADATAAESSNDLKRARLLWTWLDEIPGGDEARTQIKRLDDKRPR